MVATTPSSIYLEDVFHGLLPFEDDQVDQAYRDYLEAGQLPASDSGCKSVLIIGCGVAGMVTARFLRAAGHDVTIVEANTRVGGRCKTFRNTAKKTYFEDPSVTGEAGAMRLPDMHRLVQHLIAETGVEKQIFFNKTISREAATSPHVDDPKRDKCGNIELPPSTGQNFIHANYRHVSRADYDAKNADVNELLDYHLRSDENMQASALLDLAIGPLRDRVKANPKVEWPKIVAKYGEYSMRRFLIESVSRYSEDAIEYMGVIENLAARMAYSFIQSFIELAIIQPDTAFWLIKGGTDKLTKAYYDQHGLAEITHLNQTVTDLYRDADTGQVRITTWVADRDTNSQIEDEAAKAHLGQKKWDEVVIAIPFPAFRMVHVWPRFSQEKRRAIRELHYDAATKVLLEFRKRFWETSNHIYGGGSVTDLPNRYMYYPSERMGSDGHGVMLVSYSWADDARKWDSMCDYDRFCYALENVAITHAVHEPGESWEDRLAAQDKIRELCVFNPDDYDTDSTDIIGGATVSWMANPYAFGEAAIFYPGQLGLFHKHVVQSEWENDDGRCIAHFAGEHASLKHAWIEGAIESAMNAALVVNENKLPTLTAP